MDTIELYTAEEVAALLKVNIQTIWKWDRQGRIHGINLAGNRMKRYRRKDIEEFLDNIEKGGHEHEYDHHFGPSAVGRHLHPGRGTLREVGRRS